MHAYFFLGNSYDNLYKPARKGEAENDAFLTKAIENYKLAAEKETDPKMKKLSMDYLVAAYGPDKLNDPVEAEAIVQKMIAENNGMMTFEYPGKIGMDYRIRLPGRGEGRGEVIT